jgi:tetratricopeptide (TPR) repeat protein
LVLDGRQAMFHNNISKIFKSLGRPHDALRHLRTAVALAPQLTAPYYNLGNLQAVLGRHDLAATTLYRALILDPKSSKAADKLTNSVNKLGRTAEALAYLKEIVRLRPEAPEALHNLGIRLIDQDNLAHAFRYLERSVAIEPGYSTAYNSLGLNLHQQNRLDEAIACYDRAVTLDPEIPLTRWNRGLARLLQGRMEDGWEGHEWRGRVNGFPAPASDFPEPLWNGEERPGQIILLHTEQGFGDAVQFMRYAPMVAARGLTVVLRMYRELLGLAQSLEGVTTLIDSEKIVPHFDVQAPLPSLPRAFGTTVETIPNSAYLRAPVDLARRRAAEMAADPANAGRLRVGLVWAGNAAHPNDANRSIPIELLAPLQRDLRWRFVSLQIGPKAGDIARLPHPGDVLDPSRQLKDFADTAAVIEALDLVLTVDTAIAHVAGAVGKPVWVMLPWAPDWRWLLDRTDSPWYPTMRLFRQPAAKDWVSVVAAVATALDELASRRGARAPTAPATSI